MKLKNDNNSYELFLTLGILYSLENNELIKAESYSGKFTDLYNNCQPFLRLINENVLSKIYKGNLSKIELSHNSKEIMSLKHKNFLYFNSITKIITFYTKNKRTKAIFDRLVNNYYNYNTDIDLVSENEQVKYFNDYLKYYYIQIKTK